MPRRAKLLYERALITMDRDRQFWVEYIRFIEKNLKDPQLVRAKFENRLKILALSNKVETLELLMEQALFEEEQNQIQKARKIHENIQSEIAPDCIKTLIAFINFEKRQNNPEKVKELYFRAYTSALDKGETETVTYIVVQYSRYLAFKCGDINRAVETMNQAITKCSGSKTLYLSYVNFMKHQEGGAVTDVYGKIVAIFEKAIESSNLAIDDKREVARFYLEYLQEYCQNVSYLRATEANLKHKNLISTGKVIKSQPKQFSLSQISNEIQNNATILGKRPHENGESNGDIITTTKRVKEDE